MRALLITGMSGTGKSTVIRGLLNHEIRAIDLDDGFVVPTPDGRQRWDEPRVTALLAEPRDRPLVVAGCEDNMVKFLNRFDEIILLSVPREVLLQRLRDRSNNTFGKSDAERERILDDLERVEPLLRGISTVEIDTTTPIDNVVNQIVDLASRPHEAW